MTSATEIELPVVPSGNDDEDANTVWCLRGIEPAYRQRIKVAAARHKVKLAAVMNPALKWLLDNGWLSEPPVTTGD